MSTEIKCALEPDFIALVEVGLNKNIRIWPVVNEDGSTEYIASVYLRIEKEYIYLATRRKPEEPRRFRTLDVAIAIINRLVQNKTIYFCQ